MLVQGSSTVSGSHAVPRRPRDSLYSVIQEVRTGHKQKGKNGDIKISRAAGSQEIQYSVGSLSLLRVRDS